MSRVILDISANTHKNDWEYLKRMLDTLKAIDTGKHEVIIKHQLFEKAGDNISLNPPLFAEAYHYAKSLGYQTTSSVFDKSSLEFLLMFNIPFVKIANRRELDWLVREIPRKTEAYVSIGQKPSDELLENLYPGVKLLACVSEYPSKIKDYEQRFSDIHLSKAISDHTTNWDLFNKYQPEIYECHYVLEHDENNLDGGLFARTPQMLVEIL